MVRSRTLSTADYAYKFTITVLGGGGVVAEKKTTRVSRFSPLKARCDWLVSCPSIAGHPLRTVQVWGGASGCRGKSTETRAACVSTAAAAPAHRGRNEEFRIHVGPPRYTIRFFSGNTFQFTTTEGRLRGLYGLLRRRSLQFSRYAAGEHSRVPTRQETARAC